MYCIFLFTLHSLSLICLPYAHLVEYVFVEKGSFGMKKALPLKRWKKEDPPERECFSDEDSDEDDSNYEEIVIPKKRRAKIKLKASKAASSKRIKVIPKPQMHPTEISAARNAKQSSAKKAIETEVLIHPFSKIIQEATQLYINVTM